MFVMAKGLVSTNLEELQKFFEKEKLKITKIKPNNSKCYELNSTNHQKVKSI